MTPPPPLFHALLRPAILQILRATGYHGAKISVLDSVTDLAARYLLHLCQLTAVYATHNNNQIDLAAEEDDAITSTDRAIVTPGVPAPTIVDVRMALQRAGALLPERVVEEQEYLGEEDMRGVENFIEWATGALNREIGRIALDGDDEARDYLDGNAPSTSQKPTTKTVLTDDHQLSKRNTAKTTTTPNSSAPSSARASSTAMCSSKGANVPVFPSGRNGCAPRARKRPSRPFWRTIWQGSTEPTRGVKMGRSRDRRAPGLVRSGTGVSQTRWICHRMAPPSCVDPTRMVEWL